MKQLLTLLALLFLGNASIAQVQTYQITGDLYNAWQPIDVTFTVFDPLTGLSDTTTATSDPLGHVVASVDCPANPVFPFNMDVSYTQCDGSVFTVNVSLDYVLAQGYFYGDFCPQVNPQYCSAYFYAYATQPFADPFTYQFDNYSYLVDPGSYFVWDYGDGTIDTTQDMLTVHTYSTYGLYNVCLTAIDTANNCTNNYCMPIQIDVPGLYCSAQWWGGVYDYNFPNDVALTNASIPSPTATYTWTFGDGDTLVSNQANINHTYATDGLYQVCLTMSDSLCSDTYCDFLHVGFNQPFCQPGFVYGFVGPNNPLTLEFYNNSIGADSSTVYTWYFDTAVVVTNSPMVTYTFPASGYYNVCLNMSSPTCFNSYCETISLFQPGALCQPYFFNTPVAGQSLNVSLYNFSMPYSPTATYFWDFGDGDTLTSNLPIVEHFYNTPGYYNVCLQMTDVLCSETFCQYIEAGNVQAGNCLASMGWYQADPYNNPAAVNFYNNSVNFDVYNTSFTWDFGDGSTSNDLNPYHVFPDTGTYLVSLTMDYNGCTDTRFDVVTVYPWGYNCNAAFTIVQDTATGFIQVINQAQGQYLQYYWDFGDGNYSYDQFPLHSYAGPGVYNLCLFTFDLANACSSYYCDTVVIDSNGFVMRGGLPYLIQVIPPSQVSSPILGTGNVQANNLSMSLFPNPAMDNLTLTVQSDKAGTAQLSVLNMMGQQVMGQAIELQTGTNTQDLQIAELPKGIYLLQITTGDGQQVRKFVKS